MSVSTSACTVNALPVTLEDIQRSLAELDRLAPPPRREPFRLTRAECQRLRQRLKTPDNVEANAIFGVPVIVIEDDHPLAMLDLASRDKFILDHARGKFV